MLNKVIKYSYNDVSVVPSKISEIEHRSECNPFYEDGFLPIFTAPMSSVVDESNFDIFEENKIHAILPRNCELNVRIKYSLENKWAAFSLAEFEDFFCDETNLQHYSKLDKKALIDIANGHMKKMYQLVSKAKKIHGDKLKIMIGNIANPETYKEVWKCGADYVRVGIGGGSCCITSSNTAINYPQASLISEILDIKWNLIREFNLNNDEMPKIIADGGIRNYSDVVKAMALGADYVMIGGLLGSLIESCGKMFTKCNDGSIMEIKNTDYEHIIENNGSFELYNTHDKTTINNLFKIVYGMASKQGQLDIIGKKCKTSEGISKEIPVTTNLKTWVNNMEDYLKSAMSYLNLKHLHCFYLAQVVLISNNAKEAINK